jgi:hypothetical protein
MTEIRRRLAGQFAELAACDVVLTFPAQRRRAGRGGTGFRGFGGQSVAKCGAHFPGTVIPGLSRRIAAEHASRGQAPLYKVRTIPVTPAERALAVS